LVWEFFFFGSFLCVAATNIYLLLIGRALQGIGFASASGVAAPAVCDVYTGQDLVKAFSYIGMTMAVMPVVAPLLGGYLQYYFNWRASFVFLLGYAVIIFMMFFIWFPETNKRVRQSNIHPYNIIKNYISIICHPRYLGFAFCQVFIFAGEISYAITAPFLLQNQLGLNAVQNGWLILVTVCGFLCGSFFSKILCKKFSVTQLSLFGGITSVCGAFAMLLIALITKMSVLTIILPMILYMYGVGLIYPNAGAACMECFPEKTGSVASLGGMLSLGIGGIITTFVASLHITSQLRLGCVLLFLALLSLSMLWLVMYQSWSRSQH
jgi:MFS transporter, DHA1 family, multidrug resistance protein